jgi:hypothetical protein
MDHAENRVQTKKPYEKPRLHSISLKADEVLAKGCKTKTKTPPPTGLNCAAGGCFNVGT